jgi:uncharacterized protein YdeI (YjbR/CyaY-like superfamily)
MNEYKGTAIFYPENQSNWRDWLQENHQKSNNVWLKFFKKESSKSSPSYSVTVDEALCFGWIDSVINTNDEESYFCFFSKRNPKSNWSRVNKQKVEQLIATQQMQPAGLKMIEIAKQNGCWTALDGVENLEIPTDLQTAFLKYDKATDFFNAFSRTAKRSILEWILNAKQPATREKRINQTAEAAAINKKANQSTKIIFL